ncbi:hypothetical protein EV421DRAFT_1897053 [Armillaria borealis]|uniref:Uncharacterized protein n=1 Tax=Armillaria borealis TaxID=47425 RepID=A0AA39K6C2_9AGAR|nr:hypothetical protein EV421DRAFT_1897053 [Armillaria borealis]
MRLTLHFTEDQIDFLRKSLPDFLHEAEEFKKQFVSLLTFEFVHWWLESMDEEEEHTGMPSKATVQRIMTAMRQLDFEQMPYVLPSTDHTQHVPPKNVGWPTPVCAGSLRPILFESRHITLRYHIQSQGITLQTHSVLIRFGLAEQAHIAQAAVYWKRTTRDGQDTERCFVLLFLQEHLKLFQIPLWTGLSLAKAMALKKLLLVRHLQWSYWTLLTVVHLANASEEPPYPGPYDTRGHTLRKKKTGNVKKTGKVYVLQEYYEAEYERLVAEDEQWALVHGLASTIE